LRWRWPLAPPGAAQTTLTPAPDRITDGAISADQRGYEALQARIKALNDGGRPLRDRHLAQAQCWLDTSFHEYTRNDRGPWPQAALSQAEQLVRAMELRQSLPAETPLVAGAERIRPDLWQRAAALRGHAGWPCAQAKAACGEVELVHAGHEQAQLGWRHARPYVQIAEDLIGDAEAQAQACRPPAPAAAAVVAAAPVAVPAAPAAAPAPAAPPRAELTLFAAGGVQLRPHDDQGRAGRWPGVAAGPAAARARRQAHAAVGAAGRPCRPPERIGPRRLQPAAVGTPRGGGARLPAAAGRAGRPHPRAGAG
jgi:hypothetical protein